MARQSDTREKTRAAAALLVVEGYRPDQVTVDRILAEIGQGSRTTINDELRLWKAEQFKLNALGATVPPEVLSAVTSLWALAVEHGERAFDQQRRTLETERAELQAANVQLGSSLAQEQSAHSTTRGQIETLDLANRDLRDQLAGSHATAAVALRRIAELETEVERVRGDSEATLATLRSEHAEQRATWAKQQADQEQTFRSELDRNTARLEGVQRHVLLQVEEAREKTGRAETQLADAIQRNAQFTADILDRQAQLSTLTSELRTLQSKEAQAQSVFAQLQSERAALAEKVAFLDSELKITKHQLSVMTDTAHNAEVRLDAALRLSPKAKGAKVASV